MAAYGLATILENYPVGYEFTADNLPLHVTHVDSFQINMDPPKLTAMLQTGLARQRPVTTTAVVDEFLGPDKDVLVTKLELNPELAELQHLIMKLLENQGAIFKRPQFLKDYFHPHVSVYGVKRITVGQQVVIANISIAANLLDEPDANRVILATIPFCGESEKL